MAWAAHRHVQLRAHDGFAPNSWQPRAWRNTKVVPKRAAGGSRRRKSPSIANLSRCESTTTTRPPSLRHARHAYGKTK